MENKNGTNDTQKGGISKGLCYRLKTSMERGLCYTIVPSEYAEKKEQKRTKKKKAEFLSVMEEAMGIVKVACETVKMGRVTFYRWYDSDEEFKQEVNKIKRHQLGEVEDRLLRAIVRDESWAISLYLNRKHPDYKPRSQTEVVVGDRTYEDIVDEQKAKIKKAQKEYDDKHKQPKTTGLDKQGSDPGHVNDPKQEGATSAVPVQRGAVVLLDKKDTPKPNTESAPKGNN